MIHPSPQRGALIKIVDTKMVPDERKGGKRMIVRKLVTAITVAVFLTSLFCLPSAAAENRTYNVKVMTQNMNPGADIAAVAFAPDPQQAIAEIIGAVLASDIPGRAALVAAEIARTKPDLVALQEASRWEIITGLDDTGQPVMLVLDQLQQLLLALKAKDQHYRIAASNDLTEVDLAELAGISYVDRDAVLVRSDLPPGQLKVLGTENHEYEYLMDVPVPPILSPSGYITVLRGWIEVDVKANGARFKFAATHLESPLPDDIYPGTKAIQVAQADELIEKLQKSSFPVILTGDFNSDPTGLYPPDQTDSYYHIVAAGFGDAWKELYPEDPGYTWPVAPDAPLLERIDLAFSNGPETISIERTLLPPYAPPADFVYASDHAGVIAEFNLLAKHTTGLGYTQKPIVKGKTKPANTYWQKHSHRRF